MATYSYNGQDYELDDSISPEDALKIISSPGDAGGGQVASPPQDENKLPQVSNDLATGTPETPTNSTASIDPNDLVHDPHWLEAARVLYSYNNPYDFEGTDQALSEYGLDQMGWFNWNTPTMAVDAAKVRSAPDDVKQAFVYMMDKYDNTQITWTGTGRAIKAAAADPLTYVGLSTLGFGTAVEAGSKLMAKQAIKQLLKEAVVTGVEGAILTGTQDAVHQSVKINAGAQDGYNVGEGALATGAGAVVGTGLAMVGHGVASWVTRLLGKDTNAGARAVEKELNSGSAGEPGSAGATEVAATPEKAVSNSENGLPTPSNDNVPAVHPANDNKLVTDPFTPDGKLKSPEELAGQVGEERAAAEAAKAGAVEPTAFNPNAGGTIPDAVANDVSGLPFSGKSNPETNLGNNDVIQALKDFKDANTGMRYPGPRNAEVRGVEAGEAVLRLLRTPPEKLDAVIEAVRRMAGSGEEVSRMKDLFLHATSEIGNQLHNLMAVVKDAKAQASQKVAAQKAADELTPLYTKLKSVDTDVSSWSGSDLASRRGEANVNGFRDVSEDAFLEARGLDPNSVPEGSPARDLARRQFQDAVFARYERMAKQPEIDAVLKAAERAANDGDFAEASARLAEYEAKLAKAEEEENALLHATKDNYTAPIDSLWSKGKGLVSDLFRGAVEFAIGTVFTAKTLIVNMIPSLGLTIVKPPLDAVVRGLDGEALSIMVNHYGAMFSGAGMAMKMAKAAFRYERDMLSGKTSNWFDGAGPAIPGVTGRLIRFFPRIMLATDNFFRVGFYRAFVSTEAMRLAYRSGRDAGLTGDALAKHVNDASTAAMEKAFVPQKGMSMVQNLRVIGAQRGYEGAMLDNWVAQEVNRNQGAFIEAADHAGLNYADDLTFRRAFGRGREDQGAVAAAASQAAKSYEDFTKKNPIMKLLGQLFFRTPVRVFEEGIRLTPGINVISPNFLRDLRGLGPGGVGGVAQVRAQGEAMASMALGTSLLYGFANGNITGGGYGQNSFTQDKQLKTDPNFEPYTIKVGDFKWNYKNFDPISTPLKVFANAMEAYSNLSMREAQGDYVSKDEWNNVVAHVTVMPLAIIHAIKDANLAEGLSELVQLGDDFSKGEDGAHAVVQWLAKKAALIVPNQITTVANTFSDDAPLSPYNFNQYIAAKFGSSWGQKLLGPISHYHDALGNPVKNQLPMAGLVGVPIGERKELGTEANEVIRKLNIITERTGKVFLGQTRAKAWGGEQLAAGMGDYDLRGMTTQDGTETYYDRANRYLREQHIEKLLKPILDKATTANVGNSDFDGPVTTAVQQVLTQARQLAFFRLWKEEADIRAKNEAANKLKLNLLSGKVHGRPLQ